MPVNGSATARVCRDLLRRWLLPVLEDVRVSLGGSPLLQQSNTRIHAAKLMLSFEQDSVPLHESRLPYITPLTST